MMKRLTRMTLLAALLLTGGRSFAPAFTLDAVPTPTPPPAKVNYILPYMDVIYAGKTTRTQIPGFTVNGEGKVLSNPRFFKVQVGVYESDNLIPPTLVTLKRSIMGNVMTLNMGTPLHGQHIVIEHRRGTVTESRSRGRVLGYWIEMKIDLKTNKIKSCTATLNVADTQEEIVAGE
jgi:hypothetical protein